MYLTKKQEQMLEGEEGLAVSKSMELLVALGKVFGASKLVPVESAHVSGVSYKSLGESGLEWLEEQANFGVQTRIRATLNPAGMDLLRWREMSVPHEFAEAQLRIVNAFKNMRVEVTCTCTPYLIGHLPTKGSQIAWAESNAVAYSNSVVGARTNRESGPTSLASAITGLAPLYGYRLDENRVPQKIVDIKTELNTWLDYSALGYLTGKMLGSAVPYFKGLGRPDIESMKALGAACATSGGIALWHGEGVTPEAKKMVQQLKGKEKITVDRSDLDEVIDLFTTEVYDPVYCIGCPHCSLNEISNVAKIVKNRDLDGRLWMFTSRHVYDEAEKAGYVQIIEKSRGHVYADTCMVVAPVREMGWDEVVVNSFKCAHYLSSMKLTPKLASVSDMLEMV